MFQNAFSNRFRPKKLEGYTRPRNKTAQKSIPLRVDHPSQNVISLLVICMDCGSAEVNIALHVQDIKRKKTTSVMSANSILRGLVFGLITLSLVPVSDGNDWCNNHYCGLNEICCNDVCDFGFDCYCTSDGDCSFGQSCCKNKCWNSIDCEGIPCSTDSDCEGYTCCRGTCQTGCPVPVAIIVGSVFGGLVFIGVVSVCVCRRRIRRPVSTVSNITVTTTTGLPPANYPRYPVGQVPPPYQQGYPNYPPPQFDQLQTTALPPYNSEPARTSEHPPSYNGAITRSSGRVYVPQTSYGAAPTPSAPPVKRHQRNC